MATSTLRGLILTAAVALGLLGLTKAFPEAAPGPVAPAPRESPSPGASPTPSPTPQSPSPRPSPRVKGVVVQVLNGTTVTGLAGLYTERLDKAGYSVLEPGNATNTDVTIVYFQGGSRVDARHLAKRFFPGAQLKPADQQAASDADITVVLGADAAARASPSPS